MMRILIVDDDDALRGAIARFLGRAGYEVEEADNGHAALRTIERKSVDLVVTDINMPEMDGIEIVMALRGRTPPTPVVAMSGGGLLPKQLLLGSAEALGAVESIFKPFDLQQLLSTIERVLAQRSGASGGR